MNSFGSIGLNNAQYFNHTFVRVAQYPRGLQQAASQQPNQVKDSNYQEQLLQTRKKVVALREALQGLDPSRFSGRTVRVTGSTPTTLASTLSLGVASSTRLQSTEEVNATPTSFSTTAPVFAGSTLQATINGIYNGTNGTGTLRFEVTRAGTRGVDDLQLKVFKPDGSALQNIDIKKADALDTQYLLSNGLTFTFDSGTLVKGDTFTVDVDAPLLTSFNNEQPAFAGSTLPATIGGVYNGTNGTGTLRFEVTKAGTRGVDDLQLKVFKPDGSALQNIDIKKEDALDTQYLLSNGLAFTFDSGTFLVGDTFTVDVNATEGSVVDPNQAFNGTGDNSANLQSGFSVTAGSFKVNGETITVNANDTINSVLDRITNSNAGVTATFDVATETVQLLQNTPGATPTIALTDDTSGFLAATKLAGATPSQGQDSESPDQLLSQVAQFAGVQSGTMTVNGTNIAIDVNNDSLNDVLSRINASGAGVTAGYDALSQSVSLTANTPLVIDSGGTGFFQALGISDGTYGATSENQTQSLRTRREGLSAYDAQQITAAVQGVAGALNALFDNPNSGAVSSDSLTQLRHAIEDTFSSSFQTVGARFANDLGIRFGASTGKVVDVSQTALASRLRTRDGLAAVRDLFFGADATGQEGLVGGLTADVRQAESGLTAELTREVVDLAPAELGENLSTEDVLAALRELLFDTAPTTGQGDLLERLQAAVHQSRSNTGMRGLLVNMLV